MNRLSTRLLALALLVTLAACQPPTPTLGKLVAPSLTAQRRLGGKLQVILTYDTAKSGGCGAVQNLHATFDGQNVAASAGAFVPDGMTEADRCQFPGFLIDVANSTMPREVVFTDDVTTQRMTLTTLNTGTAVADSPPATIHSGYSMRWLTSPPTEGTSSFKATFTPTDGAEVTWLEGTQLTSPLLVTVPTQTVSSSGDLALTWLVNSTVTKCEGLSSCSVVVQGSASVKGVLQP